MESKRVFLFSIMDNAQQHWLLAKAMRDYLGWDAKSMVVRENYIGYKTDWTFEKDKDEAAEFIKDADLIMFQDRLLDAPGLGLQEKAYYKNTIINGTGSMMRANIQSLREDQQHGWAIVPMLCDTTLSTHLCAPPFENWIVPIEEIEKISKGIEKNNKISVCHAPTKLGHKGTAQFEEILQPYIESGEIEYDRITKVSWEDAIKRKARCHIVLDSLGDTHYNAGNSLEGLVLGQTVISNIDQWCYCLHPDLPMITTMGKELEDVIEHAIRREQCDGIKEEKEIACEWVVKHFSAENQIKHWKHYIKWVVE
jgi:hypothetical protein